MRVPVFVRKQTEGLVLPRGEGDQADSRPFGLSNHSFHNPAVGAAHAPSLERARAGIVSWRGVHVMVRHVFARLFADYSLEGGIGSRFGAGYFARPRGTARAMRIAPVSLRTAEPGTLKLSR